MGVWGLGVVSLQVYIRKGGGGEEEHKSDPPFFSAHPSSWTLSPDQPNQTHNPNKINPQGVKFVSETDTEVIAQLIGQGLDKQLSLRDATEEALKRCVVYLY